MKRAGRIVHRLLSGLSLLLCLASAGVWVRSYWVSDQLAWYERPQPQSSFDVKAVWCSRGGLGFGIERNLPSSIHTAGDAHFEHYHQSATEYPSFGDIFDGTFYPKPRRFRALGFEWVPRTTATWIASGGAQSIVKSFTLPLCFPCLLFAILPPHSLLRVRRRRRMARRTARGCCIACGYDLWASSGRCPECGLQVSEV